MSFNTQINVIEDVSAMAKEIWETSCEGYDVGDNPVGLFVDLLCQRLHQAQIHSVVKVSETFIVTSM